MNRVLIGLSLLFLTGCVSNEGNRTPHTESTASRINASWIDWDPEPPPQPDVPPPPNLPEQVPVEPESPQAAMEILLSSEHAALNSNWVVYNAAGRDAPYMVGTLHDLWFNHPDRRSFVAKVYCALISKGGGVGWPYGPNVDQDVAARCEAQMLELLAGMLDYSAETREGLLRISGFRMYYNIHRVFLERLERVPAGELPMWGAAIADFEKFPAEHSANAYDAIIAALEAGHEGRYPFDERGGFHPWVGTYLGNRIARNPSPDGARALEVLIRLRGDDIDNNLAWPLRSLDADWPETQNAIAAALQRDDSILVMQALKILTEHPQLRPRHSERVKVLARHYRPDIRTEAIAALPAGSPELPPHPPFRLTAEMIASLESLAPFSVAGGVRATGRVRSCGAFDDEDLPEIERPGWLLPQDPQGRYRFVSDELEVAFGTRNQLLIKEIDFGEELDARIADPAGHDPSNGDGFGDWIIGRPMHDCVRLLACLEWEMRLGDPTLPRSSALFLRLIQGYSSEVAMHRDIAESLSRARRLHCVHCFCHEEDELALLHAAAWHRYENRDIWREADYRDQVGIVEHDILRRRNAVVSAKQDSLAYWIERLPDFHIAQYSQPGGPEFSATRREVLNGIASYGLDALWPLMECIDDTRLVRGCGFWRDFHPARQLMSVGEVARWIIYDISRYFLGTEFDYRLFEPEHRASLREWLERAVAAVRN